MTKKTNEVLLQREMNQPEKTSQTEETSRMHDIMSVVKNICGAVALTTLLASTEPVLSQTTNTPVKDSVQTEKPSDKKPSGAFFISPEYSPTDKTGAIRIEGSGSFHGINVGGLLDLAGTEKDPVGVHSACGKLTISKPIFNKSKVLKGTSVAVEYTLNTATPDKVRGGVMYAHKLANGVVVFKVYPVSEKGFEPFVLAYADQQRKKFKMSAFFGTDIKSKGFYGEVDASYQLTKHIAPFVQGRFGGSYTTRVHPDAYTGVRIKL